MHHKIAAGVVIGGSLLALYALMSPSTTGLASTTSGEIGAGLSAAAGAFLLLKR